MPDIEQLHDTFDAYDCSLSDAEHERLDAARWWAAADALAIQGDLNQAALMREHGLRTGPVFGHA